MAQTLYARTVTADAGNVRGEARDITGVAERQRKIARRKLIWRVALTTCLLTAICIWLAI